MRLFAIRFVCAAALVVLAESALARDGILIVEKTTTQGTVRITKTQLEKMRMRIFADGPDGTRAAFVFDAVTPLMRTIIYEKQSYTELTEADMARMVARTAESWARMKKGMNNATPTERAEMEMLITGSAKREYRKAGTGRVGHWTCRRYDRYENGKKTSELCTVEPKAFGFTDADFDVARRFAAFLRQAMPSDADEWFIFGRNDARGFSGVPIRRSYRSPDGTPFTSEVMEVSRQSFPDDTYAVPPGFQKIILPILTVP
jgi:hypothetical protein